MYQIGDNARFFVRVNSPDKFTIWETWRFKVYADRDHPIGETDTIVDIGANIGAFSVWAAKMAHKGLILSYEPDKKNFGLLVRNKHLNKCFNIHCFCLGVCDRPGRKPFYLQSVNNSMHSLFPDDFARKTTIPCTSLDTIVSVHGLKRIDVLKIDAEGAEYPILLKASTRTLSKIQRIYLEYHDYLHHGYSVNDLLGFLGRHGFHLQFSHTPLNLKHHLFNIGFVKAFRS